MNHLENKNEIRDSFSREHGVGFAVKNAVLQHLEVESDSNEHFTTLRFNTKKETATLVSVYTL